MGTSWSWELEDKECYNQPLLQTKQLPSKQLIDGYIICIENTQCLFSTIPSTLAAILLSYYGSDDITIRPLIVKIPLKLHRYGGSRLNRHGQHGRYYESDIFSRGFMDGENDWIVFKYDALYMPKEIVIKNGSSVSANMRVSIGCGKTWIAFQPTSMHINGYSDQKFKICGISYDKIKANSFKQIKVEFMNQKAELSEWQFTSQTMCERVTYSWRIGLKSFTSEKIEIHGIKLPETRKFFIL
eukprot:551344_1